MTNVPFSDIGQFDDIEARNAWRAEVETGRVPAETFLWHMNRTSRDHARTPMQWNDGPNAGFSAASPDDLYLPIDPDPDRPTVAAQDGIPGSTLSLVRDLLALRRATPALKGYAPTRVVHAGYPFAYTRGDNHLVVVNPRREPAGIDLGEFAEAQPVWSAGAHLAGATLTLDGFGYVVLAR